MYLCHVRTQIISLGVHVLHKNIINELNAVINWDINLIPPFFQRPYKDNYTCCDLTSQNENNYLYKANKMVSNHPQQNLSVYLNFIQSHQHILRISMFFFQQKAFLHRLRCRVKVVWPRVTKQWLKGMRKIRVKM